MHVHKDCMRHSSRSVITLFIGQSVQIKKTLTGHHIDKEERNLPSSAVNSTLAVVYYLYTLAYVSSSRLFFFFLSPHLNCGSTIGETTPISLKEW